MPAYAPTANEREIVERAAGFGLPHKHICELIVLSAVADGRGRCILARACRQCGRDRHLSHPQLVDDQ